MLLNIVVPVAGRGSRFQKVGYRLPKPLIPVHGLPMIEIVINNVRPLRPHRFIFLALREHLEETTMLTAVQHIAPGCLVVPVERVTEGAASTVLLAREWLNNEWPLMIVNSDQWIDADINTYLAYMERIACDGLIMTMRANDPKWSYVRMDPDGRVRQVVEKEVVSNEATVGIYNFCHGYDFVRAADAMIAQNVRVNGEFYVAPVYNQMIQKGSVVYGYNIGEVGQGMYGLGTPSDLETFLTLAASRRAVQPVKRGKSLESS